MPFGRLKSARTRSGATVPRATSSSAVGAVGRGHRAMAFVREEQLQKSRTSGSSSTTRIVPARLCRAPSRALARAAALPRAWVTHRLGRARPRSRRPSPCRGASGRGRGGRAVAQALHDRQPEAEAAAAFARRIVELMVFLEDRLKFVVGDADAGVPDLDAQHVAVPAAAQQHLALLGVFQRVGQQVADHLLEQARIAADRQAAGHHAQGKPLRLRVIGELVAQPVEQVVDPESRRSRDGPCRPRSG